MKRIISIALILCTLLSVCTFVNAKEMWYYDSCSTLEYTAISNEKTNGQQYSGSFYKQLSSYEKSIYDKKVSYTDKMKRGSIDQFDIPVMPDIHYDNANEYNQLKSAIMNASLAFERDKPELFWLNKTVAWAYAKDNKGVITRIAFVKNNSWWCNTFTSYQQIKECEEKFDAKVEEVVKKTQGMGRYSKVKYLHDYVLDVSIYNPHINNSVPENFPELAWSAYSAIILQDREDYFPVCEAYAKAYKVLCDKAGVDCCLIAGSMKDTVGHMWTAVRMQNDKWFYIDPTFDDDNYYMYFLKGEDKILATHVPEGRFSTGNVTKFNYPAIATGSYPQSAGDALGDVNMDGAVNTGDATLILKYCTDTNAITGKGRNNIDFNCDGQKNTGDATWVLHIVASN